MQNVTNLPQKSTQGESIWMKIPKIHLATLKLLFSFGVYVEDHFKYGNYVIIMYIAGMYMRYIIRRWSMNFLFST